MNELLCQTIQNSAIKVLIIYKITVNIISVLLLIYCTATEGQILYEFMKEQGYYGGFWSAPNHYVLPDGQTARPVCKNPWANGIVSQQLSGSGQSLICNVLVWCQA